MGDRRGDWPGVLRSFVRLGLVWIVVVCVDPFGFVGDARLKSQEIAGKFMSGFYGFRTQAEGQSKIAVVLITDETPGEGETYPLPYALHSKYLDQIVQQNPAMVFVDLAFLGERIHEQLSDLTKPFKYHNIPFFFAGGGPDDKMPPELEFAEGGPDDKILPELKDLHHRAITAWEAPEGDYPLWENGRPTAAMALYQGLCAIEPGCWQRRADKHFYDHFHDNLVVQWGVKPPPNQSLVSTIPEECRPRPITPIIRIIRKVPLISEVPIIRKLRVDWDSPEKLAEGARRVGLPDGLSSGLERFADLRYLRYAEGLYMSLSAVVPGLSEHLALEPRQPCFYALTIRAESLEYWNDIGILWELLHGRVVLYGAYVSGIPDLVSSTVHGKVPGVFMHAMALDNLLTYGRRYYYDPSGLKPLGLDILVGLILIGMTRIASHFSDGWRFQALIFGVLGLGFGVTEFALHWAVGNLLGAFILIELHEMVRLLVREE